MPTIKLKQFFYVTLIFCFFIWLIRLGDGNEPNAPDAKGLAPLTLPNIKNQQIWDPQALNERLVVFTPAIKTQVDTAKNNEKSVQQAKPVQKPKPIDKTIKPMFSLLDENHQVGLLAIIQDSHQKYAILQKINFQSKATENVKVAENSEFNGLKVSINSQTQVNLSNQDKNIFLNLFKPRNT